MRATLTNSTGEYISTSTNMHTIILLIEQHMVEQDVIRHVYEDKQMDQTKLEALHLNKIINPCWIRFVRMFLCWFILFGFNKVDKGK